MLEPLDLRLKAYTVVNTLLNIYNGYEMYYWNNFLDKIVC